MMATWLRTGLLISLTAWAVSSCTTRDCTEEERAAVDAEDDENCLRVIPTKTFTDNTAEEKSVAWGAGDALIITGDVREIEIVEGSSDEVEVSFRAQVDLAEDRSEDIVLNTMADLENSLRRDAGEIIVSADHGSSRANLGSKIEVRLPSEFDGVIGIDIGGGLPGDLIDIDFMGAAQTIKVDVDSPKDLEINDVTKLIRADINTEGDIRIGSFSSTGLKDVSIRSSIGDVEVYFSTVPSAGAEISTDFGDIAIALPDTGDYTMQVQAEDGIELKGVPSRCVADSAGQETARSLTCNDGADDVTFQLRADGEAIIDFL